jgi:hypothetical protein
MKYLSPALLSGLLLAFAAGVHAQDARQLLVVKGVGYQQSGAGQPVLTGDPYRFMGSVTYSTPTSITGASLQVPGKSAVALSLHTGDDAWRLQAAFPTAAQLNLDFPDGQYVFSVQAVHDGTRIVPATVSGTYPNIPQVVNFSAAQAVDASAPFTLTWNAFTGGTAADYVRLEVDDNSGNPVFQTPSPGEPGALNGTSASSLVIPANTLAPGITYSAVLIFARISQVNATGYGQGVAAYAGHFSQTEFPLTTVTAPIVKLFGVVKGHAYAQTADAPPVGSSQPFRFQVFTDLTTTGLLSAKLTLPGGAQQALVATGGDTSPSLQAKFATQAALDLAYPSGNYTVTFQTASQGTHAVTLPLPASTYPAAPQVANFAAAQAVNPDAPFTVRWNAFPGGTTGDFVQFMLETADGNGVYETPAPGTPGALNGTATALTLPASILTPGTTYQARVLFAKFLGQDTSYGLGFSAYFSQTQFPLTAVTPPIVKRFGVVKGLAYLQTSDAAPAVASQPFLFQAFTDVSGPGLLDVSLTLPGGSQVALTTSNGDSSPSLNADYATQAGLDAAYPPGNYTVTFHTSNQGTHAVTLPLPASTFPAAPQVVNFTAAQSVDPNAAYTVRWNGFPGGTTNDFVQFSVETADGNGVFQTASPGQPDALNGTATAATIPAHTLAAGTTYRAQLIFARPLGQDTSYGLGFSAYFSQTRLPLSTSGTAVAPTLTLAQRGPSQWHLHANGALGVNYVIENTSSLVPPVGWQPMVNFQGSAAGFDFDDGVVHSANFYRVRPVN